jgi:hypothetical protein
MGWFSSLVGGVVGFFIGGPAGAVIGAGLGATKVGEKVVNSVLDFVLQPFMPKIPDIGNQDEASRQQGVLLQTQGSTVNVPIVYGFRKVGGAVVFAETGSTNNRYLYVAYVFAEGLVEGLREVYIDDWLLPVDQVGNLNAGKLVTVNADRYKDRVQLRWYPGVYYGDPKRSTVGTTVKGDIFAEAPSFRSNMNFNGLAVLFARYEWKEIKTQEDADNNPFGGSIPQVQISVLGKRVASLLVNDTETQTYDATPVRYSTNPAECLLDYLRNPRYGKGLSNSDIDWVTWKRAARKCNQTVTYLTSGIQGPIMTMNMVVDTATTLMSNTKLMLQNFRAYMPYVQGKYKLRIEDAGNETDILSGSALIVQTITKDDIVSDITFNGIEKSAKYNVVAVTYVDPDQKWSNQQVVYPESEAERQIYIDQDGGRENKYDITLGGITNYAIAKDFARLIFNKQRRQESCVFTATSKALELEPGDCIRIQSTILDFGEDPWRVVSVKINNDMTVDLGCVRNPDDIYPYVRVGEEDVVLPTYVPKGSIIYFPSSQNLPPVGLVPPTNAVFPPDDTGSNNNPPPTDPNGNTGGGVGGEGPEDSGDNSQVPPDNNEPVPPPPPPPFDAVLTVKRTQLIDLKNGTYSFAVTFAQPDAGLYSYSILWWRLNRFSPWTEVRLDTLPGAGGDIPWTLGPLPQGLYDFYARSFATDGRASSRVLQGQLGSRQDLIELGRAGLVGTSVQTVTDAWALPQSETAPVPKYDDNIDLLEIRPKLSGGLPQDPRRLRVVMTQIANTLSTPLNTLISGVRVYYKYYQDTYYSYEDYVFPADYVPGTQVTFDLTGDFGAKIYPSSIIPNTASAQLQNYDFTVRLLYADGTPAEKQFGPVRGAVEVFNGLYDFITVGTSPYSSGSAKSQLIPTDFTIATTDQDPNKSVVVGADIIAGISAIAMNRTTPRLTWNFNAVSNSKFRGFKIRYRPVISGDSPAFNEITTSAIPNEFNLITKVLEEPTFQYNQTYDWVITAQISSGGQIIDADNSLVSRKKILTTDADYSTLYDQFNFKIKNTQEALTELRTAFPGEPVLNAKSWTKVMDTNTAAVSNGPPQDIRKASNQYYINHWYSLRCQVPTTATAVILYRRVYNVNGEKATTVSTLAKYWPLGAWERVRIPISSLTADAEGWYNINVRGPVDHTLFNSYYQVPNGPNTAAKYSTIYRNKWPNNSTSGLTDMYPYAGAGNNHVTASATRWMQYLFVLEISSVEQSKGLLLRDFHVPTTSFVIQNNVDGFVSGNVPRDQIVTVSDFNTLDSGFDRRLDEAYTSIGLNNLVWNIYTVPYKLNSTSYNSFIAAADGVTLY